MQFVSPECKSAFAKIVNIIKNITMFMTYQIAYFWDAQHHEKIEEFCGTVEKGLGPRPLGPIGPIFRRTMTVTGMLI